MDQASFEVKFEIIGFDIVDFIDILKDNDFLSQAEQCELQISEQIEQECPKSN